MQKKIICYMNSVKKPVDIHDIAKGINEEEISLLDELREMKNKEIVRILPIPLRSELRSSTYYELTKVNING